MRDKTFAVSSPCEYSQKTFTLASNQHSQVPKNFEIHGITFVVQAKTVKTAKVWPSNVLYYMVCKNFEFEMEVGITIKSKEPSS